MPDVAFGAADFGTYKFALVRRDWNPRQTYVEAVYGETRKSRCVDWPEGLPLPHYPNGRFPMKGKREVCMIFVTDRHLASRLRKLGWVDVTKQWLEHFHREGIAIPTVEATGLGEPVAEHGAR